MELVALGHGDGVAKRRGVKLAGFPAWLFWRTFYLSQLMGFRNRAAVLIDWFSAYYVMRDPAKLDARAGPSLTDEPGAVRVEPSGSGAAEPAGARRPPASPSWSGRAYSGLPES